MGDFQKDYFSDTAHPCKLVTKDGHPNGESMGMSMRDYFAGQAVSGVLAKIEGNASSKAEIGVLVSEISYAIADAMLTARKDKEVV